MGYRTYGKRDYVMEALNRVTSDGLDTEPHENITGVGFVRGWRKALATGYIRKIEPEELADYLQNRRSVLKLIGAIAANAIQNENIPASWPNRYYGMDNVTHAMDKVYGQVEDARKKTQYYTITDFGMAFLRHKGVEL